MSRSLATTSWCTKVVLSGLLAGGSLALGAGTAQAGDPDPMAPVTFNDSTQPAGYTVPAGACSVTVDAVGAQGGTPTNGPVGGRGGEVVSTLAVVPTTRFQVFVGGQGFQADAPGLVRGSAARSSATVLGRWLHRSGRHPDEMDPGTGGLSGGEPTGGSSGDGFLRERRRWGRLVRVREHHAGAADHRRCRRRRGRRLRPRTGDGWRGWRRWCDGRRG